MNDDEMIQMIEKEDWSMFNRSRAHNESSVSTALCNFVRLNYSGDAQRVYDALMGVIGCDCGGEYFPVAVKVIPWLIRISQDKGNVVRNRCASAMLNNLAYFNLNAEGYGDIQRQALAKEIEMLLVSYLDENNNNNVP